jgi:hypothetical protein
MNTHIALLVTAVSCVVASPLVSQDGSPHSTGEVRCLGAESVQVKLLMMTVNRIGTRDARGYQEFRERTLAGSKIIPDSITIVADPAICAKARQLIATRLGRSGVARSNSVAVVHIAGRYVARYSHFAPAIDHDVTATYFFDSEFTRILAALAS